MTGSRLGVGDDVGSPEPLVAAGELVDSSTLWEWTSWMAQMGPRHTGTHAHDAFVVWIRNRLRDLDVTVDVHTQTFEAWDAERWSLALVDGPVEEPVEVSSYFNYSGATGPDGVVGPLVDVGRATPEEVAGADLAGAIAVVRQRTSITLGELLTYARHVGLDLDFSPEDDWSSIVRRSLGPPESRSDPHAFARLGFGIHLTPDLAPLAAAGAVGAVVVLEDASPDALRGQWAPILKPVQGLPALFVDSVVGARLHDRAAERGQARLVLEATIGMRSTDQLVVDLPGSDLDDEVVLVVTHTDGPNAVDENGPVALVSLLKLFAGRRRGTHRRRFVFVFATGHCTAGVESVSAVFGQRPDLLDRVAACLCIEHLGATEWLDSPDGMVATGRSEPAVCYVSEDDRLVEATAAALDAHGVDNVWLARPLGKRFMLGEAAAPSLLGLPTVAYLPSPTYLLAMADDGHLDKLDAGRMQREVAAMADLLCRLDAMPRVPRASA